MVLTGCLAGFSNAAGILTARYFTTNFGYKSLDNTIDTFTIQAVVQVGFFIWKDIEGVYTWADIYWGIGSMFSYIAGNQAIIYACTFGLAGPAAAMVQVQLVVHILLGVIFEHAIPTWMEDLGIVCAIAGALVMTLEPKLLCPKKTKAVAIEDTENHIEQLMSNSKGEDPQAQGQGLSALRETVESIKSARTFKTNKTLHSLRTNNS